MSLPYFHARYPDHAATVSNKTPESRPIRRVPPVAGSEQRPDVPRVPDQPNLRQRALTWLTNLLPRRRLDLTERDIRALRALLKYHEDYLRGVNSPINRDPVPPSTQRWIERVSDETKENIRVIWKILHQARG